MKKVLISLNSIALTVAIFWFINTNYDNEPLIAIITLIATLLGLIYSVNKTKYLKIKGNENFTKQTTENSEAQIDGDKNITHQ